MCFGLWAVGGKLAGLECKEIHTAPKKSKHIRELLLRGFDATVVNLKQPNRAWKHTRGASFSECHWVILADLEAQEVYFVLNFQFRTAKKSPFVWNLVPMKTVWLLSFFLDDPVGQVVICRLLIGQKHGDRRSWTLLRSPSARGKRKRSLTWSRSLFLQEKCILPDH